MSTQVWTVAEAKAKFSEIIERAMSEGPQTITRKGRTAAVVVGAEEWERKTKRIGNLAEFFAASPLRGSSLKINRLQQRPRKIRLGPFFSTPTQSRSGSTPGQILASLVGWNRPMKTASSSVSSR